MEGVEFDIDNTLSKHSLAVKAEQTQLKHSPFLSLLSKIGVADKTTANLILLGVTAVFFGIAIFIYAGTVSNNASSNIDPVQEAAQIKELEAMQSPQQTAQSATQR